MHMNSTLISSLDLYDMVQSERSRRGLSKTPLDCFNERTVGILEQLSGDITPRAAKCQLTGGRVEFYYLNYLQAVSVINFEPCSIVRFNAIGGVGSRGMRPAPGYYGEAD